MESLSVNYLTNNKEEKTTVVINIDDWLKLQ